MAITASQVKELREKTGAGMLDCKKALEENNGDIEKSVDWLRQKGIAKAAKKADRIAAEGLAKVAVDGNKACIVEINSETDFVAKNEQFLELLNSITSAILASDASTVEEASAVLIDGKSIADCLVDATATIGERITLRRFAKLVKTDAECFGSYTHMGGKICACVVLSADNGEVAKDMAMQIASMSPSYISRAHMPSDIIDRERAVQEEILKADESSKGKPEAILTKMLEGRISKSLEDMSLVDQAFFKDPTLKVAKVLSNAKVEVKEFVRYAVGEGIEKREENFAEEVAKQIAK